MKNFDLVKQTLGFPSVYMFYDVRCLDELFSMAVNDNGTFNGVFWK